MGGYSTGYYVDECPDCGGPKTNKAMLCSPCAGRKRHNERNLACACGKIKASRKSASCISCAVKKAGAFAAGLLIGTLLVGLVNAPTANAAKNPTADKLRAQLIKERNDRTIERIKLNTQLRKAKAASAPSVRAGVAESKLAVTTMARIMGVPEKVAHRIAFCESSYNARAQRPGSQYVGLFQLGRNFYPGPFLPNATAARHPWLNAAAALTVIRTPQGDRQFECSGLTGKAKPNYPANSRGWRP